MLIKPIHISTHQIIIIVANICHQLFKDLSLLHHQNAFDSRLGQRLAMCFDACDEGAPTTTSPLTLPSESVLLSLGVLAESWPKGWGQ